MKTQQVRSSGFTLIEMIGVLGIIVVLSSFLVPIVFRAIRDDNSQKLAKLLGTNVSVAELSGRSVVNVPAQKVSGVETVGNMTFIQTDAYYDVRSIREAMMEVYTFERAHLELEVTSCQMVLDPTSRVNFLLNHRPRAAK